MSFYGILADLGGSVWNPRRNRKFAILSIASQPISSGSSRFGRLLGAVRKGEAVPPLDLRYLRKGVPTKGNDGGDGTRGRVVTFLSTIYESVAETLPDARDEPRDQEDGDEYMTVTLPQAEPDPYATAMNDSQMFQKLNPKRGKSLRSVRLGVRMNSARRPENGYEKRFLPPGHIRDYYEQFLAVDSSPERSKPVAFSSFWRIWYEDFGSILQFRPTSSHTICSTCVRHKLLVQGMAGHLRARQAQIQHLSDHLRSQYLDRLLYWDVRAQSRLRCSLDVLIILDGVDQAKFQYPRSDLFRSKELAGLNRPKAHISGAILHGKGVIFWVSPACVRKDASSCIEMIGFCLQHLSRSIDLRKTTVHIQADNTPREVKNNSMIRFLASLTVHGSLAFVEQVSATLCILCVFLRLQPFHFLRPRVVEWVAPTESFRPQILT